MNGVLIEQVTADLIQIPLRSPVRIAIGDIPNREYNIVTVRTTDGVAGFGYARGGEFVHRAITELIGPMAVGRQVADLDKIWTDVYRSTIQLGRRGVMLRALSALDIAVWDARCRAADLPLWQMLGGDRPLVPCYASGGYYRDGHGLDELRAEVESYVEAGFDAVKIKVGAADVAQDIARVELVRSIVGPDRAVMVDANTGFDDRVDDAVRLGRHLDELEVAWFEEPYGPDRLRDLAALRTTLQVPIATGEQESTRWAFETMLTCRAVDILQPDVTVVGGISEWLQVAEIARTSGLKLAPHYFAEVHAQLAGAIPETAWIEYFPRYTDIVNFDDVMSTPLRPDGGFIPLPMSPGVGIELDHEAVKRFKVSS